MTGEEGIEDGDVEEEIRRELEALNDWEDDDIAIYETADLPGSMVRQKCLFILENKLVSGAYYDTS